MSSLDILKEKGVPLDRQVFTWRELAGPSFSKLNDDAFTRVRVILMNGIEVESIMFSHQFARHTDNPEVKRALAVSRRAEQMQQKADNWLLPGSWLCRTEAAGPKFFDGMPRFLECTYLGLRFAAECRIRCLAPRRPVPRRRACHT